VQFEWLAGCTRIGVTAGASTPNHLLADVIDLLQRRGDFVAEHLAVVEEDVRFTLPRELIAGRAGATTLPGGA